MTKAEARERIEKLKKEINHHRYAYHVLDKLEITEAALDSLKHELYKLEQQFPDLITSDSPTQRVGGEPLAKFKKIHHDVRMTSLEDVFSEEELFEWMQRVEKLVSLRDKKDFNFFSELKVDGFAISLEYENGVFSVGSTRGDGLIGEDVTQNLKTIESIPLSLTINPDIEKELISREILTKEILANLRNAIKDGKIEIRGEVYMTKKIFEQINKEQQEKDLPLYANPRNIAAGSIRQLDPKVAASRKLDFLAYDVVTDFGQSTHEQEHVICKLLGFKIDKLSRFCKDENEVIEFWKEVADKREKLDHLIDGVVVSVNSNKIFNDLGIVGKTPRGAMAFKFAPMEATTIVEDITVHVGRTGVLTPVAHLKPVQVGGVMISRASLHNIDEIRRLGLKIGDTVIVQRAGDVIPDVTQVLPGLRTGKEKEFHMPKKCPVCDESVIRPEGEVAYRCINKKCPAKRRENLYHFSSKKALNIVGLGPKIIDALFDQGLIQDAADLYDLKEGDLMPLERFAEKSSSNLVATILASKNTSLMRLIYGLGIVHVGEETARVLAGKFQEHNAKLGKEQRIENVAHYFSGLTIDDLRQMPDIGPKVAQSIFGWFHDKANIEFLEKLDKAGIMVIVEKPKSGSAKLRGMSFVLTGELDTISRDMAKDKIRAFGGDISESVSQKTSYVIVGKNPGSKYDKAKKLGIKIVNEEAFLKLIKD